MSTDTAIMNYNAVWNFGLSSLHWNLRKEWRLKK